MPRRVVGSANYGLYASLTRKNEKAFLCLLAMIIYDVSTDEISGRLRPIGIETRRERLGSCRLTAKVWLTDTVIAVQAIAFTGPDGDDDDEDDRNDAHEICEFELERELGHWRIVQVSGPPLPTPDTMGSVAEAAGGYHDCSAPPVGTSIAARLTAHVRSNLRGMLTATGSRLRRGRPHANASRELADFYAAAFISYSSTASISGSQLRQRNSLAGSPLDNRLGEIRLAYRIAIVILTANDIIEITHIQITGAALQHTARAAIALFGPDNPSMIALAERKIHSDTIARTILNTLARSPLRARRLLLNLLELGMPGAAPALSRANRATWNSLVLQPLNKICADPSNSDQPDPLNSITATAAATAISGRPQPTEKSLDNPHAKSTRNDPRRVPRPGYPDIPAPG